MRCHGPSADPALRPCSARHCAARWKRRTRRARRSIGRRCAALRTTSRPTRSRTSTGCSSSSKRSSARAAAPCCGRRPRRTPSRICSTSAGGTARAPWSRASRWSQKSSPSTSTSPRPASTRWRRTSANTSSSSPVSVHRTSSDPRCTSRVKMWGGSSRSGSASRIRKILKRSCPRRARDCARDTCKRRSG